MKNDQTEQVELLKSLIAQVRAYQGREPDSKFCKRWTEYVGTIDLWSRRLVAGDFAQVDIAGRIEKLSEFLALLEGGSVIDEIYEDLPFYQGFQKGLDFVESKTNDRRILAVLAATGCGKTYACIGAVRKKNARRKRVLITVPDACRENKNSILGIICKALGCAPAAQGAIAAYHTVVENLSREPKTLIFDEAHQGGVMLMRIIKDLVNRTRDSSFVYCALRTEFDRVRLSSSGAIVEAKQFLRRCQRPVQSAYADGLIASHGRDRDVQIYLEHATGDTKANCKKAETAILHALRSEGNLSTLSDVIEELQEKHETITAQQVVEKINGQGV